MAHFIIDNLMGNVPPPPAPFVQTLALRAAAPVDDPVDTATVDTTPVDDTTPVVQRKAAAQVSAPAAQAVAVVNDPAPAPAADPDPVSNEDDGGDAKEVTEEEMKSGNKAEVTPILLQNGTAGGGTALEQSLNRWKDAFNRLGLGGGAAPAAPSAPDTGGATEGDEAGS